MTNYVKENIKLKTLVMTMSCGLVLSWAHSSSASNLIQPYIINGEKVESNQHPYMGLLHLNYTEPGKTFVVTFCGGTLLNERYVLTAAHCVYVDGVQKKEDFKHLEVSFNIEKISTDIYDETKKYKAEAIYYPDSYNHESFDDDIALIKLEEAVDSNLVSANDYIKLAPSENYRANSFQFTLIGYGYTSPFSLANDRHSNRTNTLQTVSVEYLDTNSCQNALRGISISDHQICTTGEVIEGLRSGACLGDSGGPLLYSDSNQQYQAGIVSFGPETCGDPGTKVQSVYTEVADYSDWIASVMNGTVQPSFDIASYEVIEDMEEGNEVNSEGEAESSNNEIELSDEVKFSDEGGGSSSGGATSWLVLVFLATLGWVRRSKITH